MFVCVCACVRVCVRACVRVCVCVREREREGERERGGGGMEEEMSGGDREDRGQREGEGPHKRLLKGARRCYHIIIDY